MTGVGFEPTKLYTLDLKTNPFDRSGILPGFFLKIVLLLSEEQVLFCGSNGARTHDLGVISTAL